MSEQQKNITFARLDKTGTRLAIVYSRWLTDAEVQIAIPYLIEKNRKLNREIVRPGLSTEVELDSGFFP